MNAYEKIEKLEEKELKQITRVTRPEWYTRYSKSTGRIYRQSHEYFKKTGDLISLVNLLYINEHPCIEQVQCDIMPYYEVAEAELDEMWSYVFSKKNPRWLWLALDHQNI